MCRAFTRGFVQYLLPPLKFAQHSAFRISNLGNRYEWGAIRVAEQHYATMASEKAYKLMVVKVNAHVGIGQDTGRPRFGFMKRYDSESPCCGALHALLEGTGHEPFVEQLREAFTSEGRDRLATLRDERFDRIRKDVDADRHRQHPHARVLLAALIPVLAEFAPVPAAVLLFGHGLAGIHHAFRVHRLSHELEGSVEARRVLQEIHDRIDQFDPARAEAMIELLMNQYRS